MIDINRRMALLGALFTSSCAGAAVVPYDGRVPEFSLALQEQLPRQPPLLAIFRQDDRMLGFAAVHHALTEIDPAFEVIRRAFAEITPAAVIIEGVETGRGENPRFLVTDANRAAASDNPFASGEPLYTAQLAIKAGVPFWGGEPQEAEIYRSLLANGFDAEDSFYAALFGPLLQSVRQGELSGTSDPRFDTVFEGWAKEIAGGLVPAPDTSAQSFRAWYLRRTGISLDADPSWLAHSDPDHAGPIQAMNKERMRLRDEHLLDVITARLESHRRVVTTYGGSHFATLWRPLMARLGRPVIS